MSRLAFTVRSDIMTSLDTMAKSYVLASGSRVDPATAGGAIRMESEVRRLELD